MDQLSQPGQEPVVGDLILSSLHQLHSVAELADQSIAQQLPRLASSLLLVRQQCLLISTTELLCNFFREVGAFRGMEGFRLRLPGLDFRFLCHQKCCLSGRVIMKHSDLNSTQPMCW